MSNKFIIFLLTAILLFNVSIATETTLVCEDLVCPDQTIISCWNAGDHCACESSCTDENCKDYTCSDGSIAHCEILENGICNCETCEEQFHCTTDADCEDPKDSCIDTICMHTEPPEHCEDFKCPDGSIAHCYIENNMCVCQTCEVEEDGIPDFEIIDIEIYPDSTENPMELKYVIKIRNIGTKPAI